MNALVLCANDASISMDYVSKIGSSIMPGESFYRYYLGFGDTHSRLTPGAYRRVGDVRNDWPSTDPWPARFDLIIDEHCPKSNPDTDYAIYSLNFINNLRTRLNRGGFFVTPGGSGGIMAERVKTRTTSRGNDTVWCYIPPSKVIKFMEEATGFTYKGRRSIPGTRADGFWVFHHIVNPYSGNFQ